MLKSKAYEHLLNISESADRTFEDFLSQYEILAEVVKEFPDLSSYVLPIVVGTVADRGFNADVQPTAAKVFNTAALQLNSAEIMESFNRLFVKNPRFAFYTLPDLLKSRPDLCSAVFPKLLQEALNVDDNGMNACASALAAAVVNAEPAPASAMLEQVFADDAEKRPLSRKLYGALGKIYSVHPQLKEQIFGLLEAGAGSEPELYGALYRNLGKMAAFDAGIYDRCLTVMEKYVTLPQNTPFSLSQAYKSVGETLLPVCEDQKQRLEAFLRLGLENPANNLSSRKIAWRLLNQRDQLVSRVLLGRRGEKNEQNKFGWYKADCIDRTETCVLVLGGDGVRNEKAANGYMGDIYRLLEENGLEDLVKVYGAVYDFGEYMNENDARTQLFREHRRKIELKRPIDPDSVNPAYIRKIFDAVVKPRLTDADGTRIDGDKAADNVRKLTIVAHCHGAYTALKLEQMMQSEAELLGYDAEERRLIQKQMLVLAQSPYCPLGESRSTFISFGSAADYEVNHYNLFEKSLRALNREKPIPLSYFPDRQGNIFLTGSMGSAYEQHNFWGCHPLPEMSREGQALTALSAKILINGLRNALEASPRLPSVEQLAATDAASRELFDQMTKNGKEVYKQICLLARKAARSGSFYE